jgi:hypothetical protein
MHATKHEYFNDLRIEKIGQIIKNVVASIYWSRKLTGIFTLLSKGWGI